MIIILLLSVAYSVINFVRGRGNLPSMSHFLAALLWAWCTGLAAATMGYTEHEINRVMAIAFVGDLCWIVPGWGLYFASYTGIWKQYEVEIPFIDRIGFKLVPFVAVDDQETNRLRGTICMALRGFIFSFPLFAGLAWCASPAAFLFWPLMLLQGPIYYLNGPLAKYGSIMPEIATGALLGLLVGMGLGFGV